MRWLFCFDIVYLMKVNKLEQPKKTFFFERHDNSIISVGETEAWNLYARKNQVIGFEIPRPKLIGTSDGKLMYQAIQEAHKLFAEDPEKSFARIRQGEKEELEAARGNIIPPRNMDKQGDGAQFI